jgi:two-component system chemotaxis response regulator CheB
MGGEGDGVGTASTCCDIVVLAASAGALPAFREVMSGLPCDFPSAVIVVGHRRADGSTFLFEDLRARTALPMGWVRPGEIPHANQGYVVPNGQDLTIDEAGAFAFAPGTFPFRGIDPLIGSLAEWAGCDGTAVILTGTGEDGAAGSLRLHHAGGTVIVQSTESVAHVGMGRATIDRGAASFILPLHEIAPALVRLARPRRLLA